MIYSIKGHITEVKNNFFVVDTLNNVEMRIFIPPKDYEYYKNFNKDDIVKVFTVLNIKETAFELIGFKNNTDKEMFLLLNNISGVGVKVALSIISELTLEEIVFALKNKKEKVFTRVKGIGNKAANRIIMDIKVSKDFLEKFDVENLSVKEKLDLSSENVANAIEALASLGYKKTIVKECFEDVDLTLSTEELIKICLKKLNKNSKI